MTEKKRQIVKLQDKKNLQSSYFSCQMSRKSLLINVRLYTVHAAYIFSRLDEHVFLVKTTSNVSKTFLSSLRFQTNFTSGKSKLWNIRGNAR